ncbi:unnamed protein product [Vitrella brassicaformis CCMP3155]|uniref:Uncharacterized protein n=2 Tax=Vitrella brassicaformis TaxID=1169539 RepID=A0A0G4E948_VITBC|nr:unnamed protein product [Vitrella brassicaformis CCMP3155]|eukprot:CEL92074.1 unnamed protein product [Vitrella brassicaformis CCMP3155]
MPCRSSSSAAADPPPREYFYVVGHQGHLFLEDTEPKNIATSLKDGKFLDFFWRQLRENTSRPDLAERYPWVSPCGRELNWVRAEEAPIVFHSLCEGGDAPFLTYAGSLRVPFHPEQLVSSRGRFFHPSFFRPRSARRAAQASPADSSAEAPIREEPTLPSTVKTPADYLKVGLLSTHVAVALADRIQPKESVPSAASHLEHGGRPYHLVFEHRGVLYPIVDL